MQFDRSITFQPIQNKRSSSIRKIAKNRRAEKKNDTTGVTNKFHYTEFAKERTQTVE